ncbi:MAG: dethiobiotin synthase [Gammaproteobacteria bacterium]|nr:dethiobiotin synthase [Gammaproteobacteria bacterium]
MAAYFVTGTDTGVGKTLVCAALLQAGAARALRTIGLKPVAAGCELHAGAWCNADALLLQRCASERLDYAAVNPVALRSAVAPHLAAAEEGVRLDVDALAAHCRAEARRPHDLLLVEGAGGWLVPLGDDTTMADLATALGWPVLMVVALRLGCLNHALLTAAAIRATGLVLAGWVANETDPAMARMAENMATLEARLGAPRLGTVPWLGPVADPQLAAAGLGVERLCGRA